MHLILLYLGILVGVFFEGEMVMLSSILAARHGYLNFWLVLLVGSIGTYITDAFYFTLGRRKGRKWINKKPKLAKKAAIVDHRIHKYPILIFILYRFLYGFRSLTPLVIGTTSIKSSRFFIFSAMSILLWATTYGLLGYFFGKFIETNLSHIAHAEKYIIAFVLMIGIALLIRRYYTKRKLSINPDQLLD
ncbi:DedA family protein [Marinilongibacter aquaticus]|uniref:DedA family protein n=1 Tax=Marinilongibacter aquaticus TaxID=2975157 RepID=UPI0021BD0BF9|nr:DedA family protein [Marinilongibacter aquaticus]UBM58296.1 DedA family protein [Marinilongibacter aquaticus]